MKKKKRASPPKSLLNPPSHILHPLATLLTFSTEISSSSDSNILKLKSHGTGSRSPPPKSQTPLAGNRRPPPTVSLIPPSRFYYHHQFRRSNRRGHRETPRPRPRKRRHSLQSPAQAHIGCLRAESGSRRHRFRHPPSGLPRDGDSPSHRLSFHRSVPWNVREARRSHRDSDGVHGRRNPRSRPQNHRKLLRTLPRHRSSPSSQRPQLSPPGLSTPSPASSNHKQWQWHYLAFHRAFRRLVSIGEVGVFQIPSLATFQKSRFSPCGYHPVNLHSILLTPISLQAHPSLVN
ncbi:hypothetical protein U1Q18_003497 [Sarracenia purpurea var. burkii]